MVVKEMVAKVWKSMEQIIELPEKVQAKYENYNLIISGEKGELTKMLKYPNVSFQIKDNKIRIYTDKLSKNEKKIINTYRAHANNLIKGVTEGFNYKLRVVYAKFPITLVMAGKVLTIKNFLGEKKPRVLKLYEDVNVKINGAEIEISGIDKERCGQQAASIEAMTRINHLDRRVIQDGVYIIEKPHKRYCE